MPMGMAEIAVALWAKHYRHNPANPQWSNRDRFVLSNGHGSMLHYALLHLTGYDLSMEEIRNFPNASIMGGFCDRTTFLFFHEGISRTSQC